MSGRGFLLKSVTLDQLIALNREIVALAKASVPLDKGLLRVAEEFSGPTAAIAQRIADRTAAGANLSEAIEAEGDALPATYRALVQAGLESGKLTAALEGYGQTAERMADLRRTALLAAIYPLLVVCAAWLLLLFVGNALLPTLDWIGINNRFWISGVRFPMEQLWVLAVIVPVLLLLAYGVWWRGSASAAGATPSGRFRWMSWIPGVMKIQRLGHEASFADLLGLFVTQHVPLDKALPLAADASGLENHSSAAHELGAHIAAGNFLRTNAAAFRQLPPLVRLALSDERGPDSLAANLRLAATSYQRRAQNLATRVTFYFPIALTAVVGGAAVGLYTFMILQPYAATLREIAQWH